jgi:hypothetical protein
VRFYRLPPQVPYEEVGHGFISSQDHTLSRVEAEAELSREACSLHADAVVITQESYGGRCGSLVVGRFIRFVGQDKAGDASL